MKGNFCIIQIYMHGSLRIDMALTPNQIAELLKLRALGWSQSEIAERLNTSQQVIDLGGRVSGPSR